MSPETRWFERRFAFDLPDALFGNVVERVRGTPARLEERVRGMSAPLLFVAEHDDHHLTRIGELARMKQ